MIFGSPCMVFWLISLAMSGLPHPTRDLSDMVKTLFPSPHQWGTQLFISFHPRSSIQYNMCYERKYCKCCRSEHAKPKMRCAALIVPFASAAARNPRLQFLYGNFFTTFGRKTILYVISIKAPPIISTKFLGN